MEPSVHLQGLPATRSDHQPPNSQEQASVEYLARFMHTLGSAVPESSPIHRQVRPFAHHSVRKGINREAQIITVLDGRGKEPGRSAEDPPLCGAISSWSRRNLNLLIG
jgi:hypothetical protein